MNHLKLAVCLFAVPLLTSCSKKTVISSPPAVQSDCDGCGKEKPLQGLEQPLPVEDQKPKEPIMAGFKSIYFDFNSTKLDAKAIVRLKELAKVLQEYRASEVRLTGHADPQGPADYNMLLSKERVNSVALFLNKELEGQVQYRVFAEGENKPVCTERSVRCYKRNRRVEILAVVNP